MDDIIQQCRTYWWSAGRKELAHYLAAELDSRRNRRLGIPSVILSTFVATSVFAALNENVNVWLRVFTGVTAVAAAILTALQTFLAFGDRAEKHLAAAGRFGKARRELDVLILQCGGQTPLAPADALATLKEIAEALSSAEADTPSLSKAEYEAGEERFNKSHPVS